MPKIAIALDERHQQEIQMILTDGDAAAALRFLKEGVWSQVQAVRRKGLHSHLDAGRE
jgi:hypothetical protein